MPDERASELAGDATADAVAIQPHAMLLVLDPAGARIVGASANAASWFGRGPAASLVGVALDDLIDADTLARLRATLAAGALERPVSVHAIARADGAPLGFGLVHRVAGHPLLEIEAPVEDETQETVPAAWLDNLLAD